jgi:hypothetical protein
LVSLSSEVSLELDLTALSAVGTSGAGLMANPPAHDFGLVRTHLQATSLPAFTVQSIGTLAAQIQNVELIGRDAAEFGAAQIHPFFLRSPRSPAVGQPLPTLTPPFFVQAGSSIAIDLTPSFQTAGIKQAQLRITFEDVQQTPHTLILPVTATAVTPLVNIEPQQLVFVIPQNSSSFSLDRAMYMSNDAALAFTRQSLSISGPESGDFRIDGSEHGVTPSDLSQPLTLNPGDSETYRLGFYPSAPGDRYATLTINTSEGSFTVPLSGHCDGTCRQPPPPPTYRVPPPPEHPVLPELRRGYTLKSY